MQRLWFQFITMTSHCLKNEWAQRERLFSPLLFALTFILLFWFALGELADELKLKLYAAQTFLAAMLALQISYLRMYEPDEDDDAFTMLRTLDVAPTAWFFSRYITVWGLSFLILIPTKFLAALFLGLPLEMVFSWFSLVTSLLALAGLAALGLLLATMTMRVEGRHILFPVIYFPLTVPVLLAAVNATLMHWQEGLSMETLLGSWLGLLLAFDVIYISLSWVLFGELVKPE